MRREFPKVNRCLILTALLLVIASGARATDLSGQVTEVINGHTINLKSLSHTIKVRLLAIEPPDKNQPYAEAARKHLADLVLGKYVVVHYTGIGSQGYLVGRILLEQADINAQMLRDGVAWYQPAEETDLSESERQLYPACEQAARAEKRGLWQDNAPESPWAFRRRLEEKEKQFEVVAAKKAASGSVPTMDGLAVTRKGELAIFTGPPVNISGVLGSEVPAIPFEKWDFYQMYSAKGSTVLVPRGGLRSAAKAPLPDGRAVDYETYVARSGSMVYVVLSSRVESSLSERDNSVIDATIESFMMALRNDYHSVGRTFSCAARADAKTSDYEYYKFTYHARKYDLVGCNITGHIYIYTSVWKYREVHVLAALSLDGKEDPNTKLFMKSLKISSYDPQ